MGVRTLERAAQPRPPRNNSAARTLGRSRAEFVPLGRRGAARGLQCATAAVVREGVRRAQRAQYVRRSAELSKRRRGSVRRGASAVCAMLYSSEDFSCARDLECVVIGGRGGGVALCAASRKHFL
ncbi:hypothetical protein J6590_085021 [Homalodisca vitripennis]|nr:hypothetical protein J6590_085021 [Homalodisca vitripennis]